MYSRNRFLTILFAFAMSLGLAHQTLAKPQSYLGKQKFLVLLVEWSDVRSTVKTKEVQEAIFGKSPSSLASYFNEVSAGKFSITGEVMPWMTSSKTWSRNFCRPTEYVREAWKLHQGRFDPKDFDSNRDGKVDHILVIFSGRTDNDRLGANCFEGRVSFAEHASIIQSQGMGKVGDQIPIGLYLHEAGHNYFRLPDLYGSHYAGRYGIGMWGMMGLGTWGTDNQMPTSEMFRYPAHFEPRSKEIMGWGNWTTIDRSINDLTLDPVETSGQLVKIQAPSGVRYYLEYRSARGFSKNHPGHGLLIWKENTIIQADGRDDINNGTNLGRRPVPPIAENFGDDSDPFPGSMNITEYQDRRAGLRFYDIQEVGEQIKLKVEFLREFDFTRPEDPNPWIVIPTGPEHL